MRIPEGQYLSVRQYADRAGKAQSTIYKALRERRLKGYKVDGTYLIPFDALIVDRRIKSGRYVGVAEFNRTLDVEELARKRGLIV